jgi:hypothetical protein
MLSSVFLPWLLLPFEANFHCGLPPSPIPSSCPGEGLVASQVSLWQVFTQQVPQTSNEPLTYIGMLPVGMALITLALGVRSTHRHVLLVRLGYVSALVLAAATQSVITALVGSLSPYVVTAVTNRFLLLAVPYLVETLIVLGGLALFVAPAPHSGDTSRRPARTELGNVSGGG